MKEHISCDCKCKFSSTTMYFESPNGKIKHAIVKVKIIVKAKKIMVGIQAHVFVRIVSI